jgi:hypothetical protein
MSRPPAPSRCSAEKSPKPTLEPVRIESLPLIRPFLGIHKRILHVVKKLHVRTMTVVWKFPSIESVLFVPRAQEEPRRVFEIYSEIHLEILIVLLETCIERPLISISRNRRMQWCIEIGEDTNTVL